MREIRARFIPQFEALENRLAPASLIAVGTEPGVPTTIRVFQPDGTAVATITPFASGFLGGVRVAVADVSGDSTADIIAAAGPGAGPHVKVFDGVTFAEIASFYAFQGPTPGKTFQEAPYFDSGMFAGGGDVDGDGRADIIVGADVGGRSHFKVMHMSIGGDGRLTPVEVVSQFAFDLGFNGGVRVAAVDVTGDGRDEVAIAAGPGAGPHVKIFSYNGSGTMDLIVSDWVFQDPVSSPTAFFDSGMIIAGGDVDGDGMAELFVGAGAGAGPHAKIFKVELPGTPLSATVPHAAVAAAASPPRLQEIDSFYAYDFDSWANNSFGLAAVQELSGLYNLATYKIGGQDVEVKIFKHTSPYNRTLLRDFNFSFPSPGSDVAQFAGGYSGSYSGSVTVDGITFPVGGGVSFEVFGNGVIAGTATVPTGGSVGINGTVAANGTTSIHGATGGGDFYTFTGSFVLMSGGVSAQGTWSTTGGGGSWNASRLG